MPNSELCEKCAHTKVCFKDKNLIGDVFVAGNPMLFDNKKLYEKFKERENSGFPCDDFLSMPRWIPVTEHTLPNHNSVVVVCGKKGTWDFGTYRGHTPTNINLWNWKKNTLKKVYWWMYKEDALQTPWKGESDG